MIFVRLSNVYNFLFILFVCNKYLYKFLKYLQVKFKKKEVLHIRKERVFVICILINCNKCYSYSYETTNNIKI